MSLKEIDKVCAAITQRAMAKESRDPRKHTMHPERIEECADICMGALCAVLQSVLSQYDLLLCRPTACVTGKWAGLDSVWEREKLEAKKTA